MNSPITQEQFAGAFWAFVRNVAAVITAIATIVGVSIFLAKPSFDAYIKSQTFPLIESLTSQNTRLLGIEAGMAEIRTRLNVTRPFIEFGGRGVVIGRGPFRPGGIVQIEYFLQRNLPCSTEVLVQFGSARNGRVVPELTATIQATRAPASFHPIPFILEIRLPENMPEGWFNYRPVLRPDVNECPGQTEVHVPPSMYFEVVND